MRSNMRQSSLLKGVEDIRTEREREIESDKEKAVE